MTITSDLVGHEFAPRRHSWTERDTALYALGIGAGQDDPAAELEFTIPGNAERQQVVYPTFAVIPGAGAAVVPMLELLADAVDPRMMLHGEQRCEQVTALPVEATVAATARITALWDKQTATVVETCTELTDVTTGELYARTVQAMFFRGVGGWGGERGPSTKSAGTSDREPDKVLTEPVRADQALVYRLSGDNNPLHLDPDVATSAGFERPILQGLCMYGIAGRMLLHAYADGDPARFVSLTGRFSKPTYPGDTLSVRTWSKDGSIEFVVQNHAGDVLLRNGEFRYTV
jgi:acyl dehydratase